MSDTQITRDSFLNSLPEPAKPQRVYIESLGDYVYLKGLTAMEQEAYERTMFNLVDQGDGNFIPERDTTNMRVKYLVFALCDEQGNRLFGDDEYELLGQKLSGVIKEMHDQALRVAGTHPDQLEEEGKNSEGRPDGSSSD
jgi:hypothetical protein